MSHEGHVSNVKEKNIERWVNGEVLIWLEVTGTEHGCKRIEWLQTSEQESIAKNSLDTIKNKCMSIKNSYLLFIMHYINGDNKEEFD